MPMFGNMASLTLAKDVNVLDKARHCKLVALAQQGKQMALQASSHDLTNAVIRPQTLGYHLGLDTVLPKLRWDGTTSQPTAAAHPP